MILVYILATLLVLLTVVLSIPVRIRVESRLVCYIYWFFIKVRIRSIKGNFKTDFKLFNRKTRFFSAKKSPKEKAPSEKKKSKKKKKKELTKDIVLEILKDRAVKKILRISIRFLNRCIHSIRISFLNWDVGLKDYYWQGILFGLLAVFPRSEDFRIAGNFQEINQFQAEIKISILRLVTALFILVFSFPYIRALLLYRRVFLRKGKA